MGIWDLNALLVHGDIDPRQVIVMRHGPHEQKLRKVLPWLAAERPDVFNAYQQTQGEKIERAMLEAKCVASFIGNEPGKAVFGLSRNEGFGMTGFAAKTRASLLWFDLALTDFRAAWKGTLVIEWPPP